MITTGAAHRVWDILVKYAGADEEDRFHFLRYVVGKQYCDEYRFQGKLGFGGKVSKFSEQWYVQYYLKDKTDYRDSVRAETNLILGTEVA